MTNNYGPTLVISGGAGTIERDNFPAEEQQKYLDALKESLRVGYKILIEGGSSIDAVEASVISLEDCPLFNAGKGSVFTIGGKNELESSIMLGIPSHTAGACTLLHTIKNPIVLAKTLLLDPENPHVFLGGIEAEKYAKSKGLEMVDPSYFFTEQRWKQHMDGLEKGKSSENIGYDAPQLNFNDASQPEFDPSPMGTVGAVAVDVNGIIAAATSTGGFNNKKDGRIGDTPLIACGTWADNDTCGVSGTGNGEYFIRFSVARDVSARMQYLGENLHEAATTVIENLRKVGGNGGVVALDKYGNVAMPFNTSGMYRGYIRTSDGIPHAYIF
ncbi:10270_t:CDS:2 [Acaulospora colombiana]|uniref:10270_t:CDS:1 n=1 Tax=Acaulospora colombiana TaxID=27376 RepID=A0ACA9M7S5_9GLOM|nr:10270_t:CDS:2 [Acaulospora colombiana]